MLLFHHRFHLRCRLRFHRHPRPHKIHLLIQCLHERRETPSEASRQSERLKSRAPQTHILHRHLESGSSAVDTVVDTFDPSFDDQVYDELAYMAMEAMESINGEARTYAESQQRADAEGRGIG